jgi:excisionase family DNA binding protein
MSDRPSVEAGLLETLRPLVAELVARELEQRLAELRPRDGDDVLSVAEVAAIVHVSPKVVYGALERGELTGAKPCSRWRVRRSHVDAWLESKRAEPRRAPPTSPRARARTRRYGDDAGLRRLLRSNETKEAP